MRDYDSVRRLGQPVPFGQGLLGQGKVGARPEVRCASGKMEVQKSFKIFGSDL